VQVAELALIFNAFPARTRTRIVCSWSFAIAYYVDVVRVAKDRLVLASAAIVAIFCQNCQAQHLRFVCSLIIFPVDSEQLHIFTYERRSRNIQSAKGKSLTKGMTSGPS
jgi:hypothetical protein